VLNIIYSAGEGLGSERRGRADPIMAGDVKKDHLGVGAVKPGEVTSEDDIYEQYKKRMMLGYRHRPNPLVYLLPLSTQRSVFYFCLPKHFYYFCRTIQGNNITDTG
jgi:splicing factor 4